LDKHSACEKVPYWQQQTGAQFATDSVKSAECRKLPVISSQSKLLLATRFVLDLIRLLFMEIRFIRKDAIKLIEDSNY